MSTEIWELWYPNAAARGLYISLGRMDHFDEAWVHAAPDSLRVAVRSDDGELLAEGDQLARQGGYLPFTHLRRDGRKIIRSDYWPSEADYGKPIILPGGEIGILQHFWHAEDDQEWRWQIELYNQTRS